MNKYYIELGEYHYENDTSWTETLGVVVIYAKTEHAAFELAERLHEGFSIGWPTTEEPAPCAN